MGLSAYILFAKFEYSSYNSSSTSITIRDDDDTYSLTASYDADKTGRVQQYINHSIQPNGLFSGVNDYLNVSTTLSDKTEFHVKESPGKLEIELNKKRNTTASYYRIKKMCEGVKTLLNGK